MQTALDIAILRARCARRTPLAVIARPPPPPRQTIEIVERVEPSQVEVIVTQPIPWRDRPSLHIVSRVIRAACNHFGVSQATLCGPDRSVPFSYARHVAMYVSRMVAAASYPVIGRRFGGRDHTTVLHAYRRIERMRSDPHVVADCEDIARAIGEVI